MGARIVVGLVEAVAALAGLVMLATAVMALRLAWGPIEVDFLAPALTQALDVAADPLSVSMDGASVSWGTGRPTVDLVARNLRLTDPAGTAVLTLPKVAVSLSVNALFAGGIAPTRVAATGPRLHIIRTASGEVGVVPSAAEAAPDAAPIGEPWPQMLRALAGKPRPGDPLGGLERVSLDEIDAVVDDRVNGLVWRLSGGSASATRSPEGLAIGLGGRVGLGSVDTMATATVRLDTAARTATLDADFKEFNPSGLASALPSSLGAVEAAQFPASGRLKAILDVGTMRLGPSDFEFHGSAGAIVDPRLAGGRLAIRSLDLDAAYEPATDRLELRRLALDLDGPLIEASGTLAPTGRDPLLGPAGFGKADAKGRLRLRNLPLDRFASLWPPGVAPDARRWITDNLSVGKVDTLVLDADASVDPAAAHPVAIAGFSGTLGVVGGTVNYLDGLPHLEGVDATIGLSPQKLDFTFTAGRMQGNGLVVTKGTATIDGFDRDDEHLTLDIGLKGPATDVMTVLDAKRLQYTKAIGMTPDRISGTVDGSLHFRFALKRDLPLSEIEYGARARLTDLRLAQAAFASDLTQGSFDLVLDHDHVSLDGIGRLGDVPAKITWTQRIAGSVGDRSAVHAVARLDKAARERFGFDYLPDMVKGPVDADIEYRVADEHAAAVTAKLDLTPADLAFDLAGWSKAAGSPADATFRLDLADGHVVRLAELAAHAPGLDLAGAIDFSDGRIRHAAIDRLVVGNSDATGTVDHGETGPWALSLRCKTLDLEPVRTSLTSGPEAPPGDEGPSLALDITCDKLLNGPGRELRQATFKGSVAHHTLLSASLAAEIGKAGKLDFRLDPVEAGGAFKIDTNDFGALLKVGGITDNLIGGSLTLSGTSAEDGAARRFTGKVDGRDYRVLNTPFLTRLFSLASFQAIGSMLSGEGIPFSEFKADLSLKQGLIDVKHGHAYGSALGVTADGWIDTHSSTLYLEGRLVPANLLNSFFSDVPVLGPLLIGPEGSGLFAVNVRLCGRLAEPTVSANPLSLVAPGNLKELPPFGAIGPACNAVADKLPP